MASDQEIVELFIQGKFQNRFVTLSEALCEFFNAVQPDMERVNLELTVFQKKPIATLRGRELKEIIQRDTDGARKDFYAYGRMFGRIDHHLAIMGSNFGLPNFLQENNFPPSRFNEFQDYLKEYWEITYGQMMRNWGQIKTELFKLRETLEKEIMILEHLPNDPYFDGIEENAAVRVLFFEERKQFYKIMGLYKELNSQMLSKLSSMVSVQASKTRAELKAAAKILKDDFRRDLNSVRTRSQKSVVALIYLIGMFKMLTGLKTKLKTKAISKVTEKVVDRLWRYAKIEQTSGSLESAKADSTALLSISAEMIDPAKMLQAIEGLARAI